MGNCPSCVSGRPEPQAEAEVCWASWLFGDQAGDDAEERDDVSPAGPLVHDTAENVADIVPSFTRRSHEHEEKYRPVRFFRRECVYFPAGLQAARKFKEGLVREEEEEAVKKGEKGGSEDKVEISSKASEQRKVQSAHKKRKDKFEKRDSEARASGQAATEAKAEHTRKEKERETGEAARKFREGLVKEEEEESVKKGVKGESEDEVEISGRVSEKRQVQSAHKKRKDMPENRDSEARASGQVATEAKAEHTRKEKEREIAEAARKFREGLVREEEAESVKKGVKGESEDEVEISSRVSEKRQVQSAHKKRKDMPENRGSEARASGQAATEAKAEHTRKEKEREIAEESRKSSSRPRSVAAAASPLRSTSGRAACRVQAFVYGESDREETHSQNDHRDDDPWGEILDQSAKTGNLSPCHRAKWEIPYPANYVTFGQQPPRAMSTWWTGSARRAERAKTSAQESAKKREPRQSTRSKSQENKPTRRPKQRSRRRAKAP